MAQVPGAERVFEALLAKSGPGRVAAVTQAVRQCRGGLSGIRDSDGITLLCHAALHGLEKEALSALVHGGCSVDAAEPGGLRLLHVLVSRQRPQHISHLLALGTNWRLGDRNHGDCPLHYAISRPITGDLGAAHRTAAIRHLTLGAPEGAEAAILHRHPSTGYTALHVAAEAGDAATLAFFLAEAWDLGRRFPLGAPVEVVDAADYRGHTALWVASSKVIAA